MHRLRLCVSLGIRLALLSGVALPLPVLAQTVTLPPITVDAPHGTDTATSGRDVTIPRKELDRTRPQTMQTLFSGQTAVSAGGTSPASTKVYVHGLEETLLNVQIDGARQPQRSGFHHNGNNLIDPAMLKAVAVDAGVTSADAGPHALGGAIRYTTRDVNDLLLPGRSFGGFGALSWDSNARTFRKSGALYGKHAGLEILGYGMFADGNAYKDGNGRKTIGTDVDITNYLGKIAYETSDGHRFALSGERIEDEGTRPFRANFALIPGFNIPYSFARATRDTYSLQYRTTQPGTWFDPEISIYSNKSRLYRPPQSPCAPGSVAGACVAFGDGTFESVGGKAQNTFVLGPGKLTAGVDFYQDRTSINHFGNQPRFGERLTNVGGYAQYRFSPFQRLRVSTGLRLDRNELDAQSGKSFQTNGWSPNVGGEFDITGQITAKASFGYTFGGIPLYESFLLRQGFPLYSDRLGPQKARSYKAGLQFKEGGLLAEATYFNTQIFDPVCPNCSPVTNLGKLETYGFDLTLRYAWSNGQVGAGFTHTDTEFDGGQLTTLSWYAGTPFGDVLKLHGHYEFQNLGIVVGFLSQIVFDYDKAAAAAAPGGRIGVLQGCDVHNVFAQWTPEFAPNLALRAEVLNLTDADYVDRASAVGGTIVPLLSQGRTFLLSARVQF